jgi:predicted nucleic-acid-binding protein
MSIAIDTNVLVRLLVRDDEAQFNAARKLVKQATAANEPILILLCAVLEAEWVLRSRYKLDKASIASAFAQLLESRGVILESEPALEETLYLWSQHASADFADCLLSVRAIHLGCTRFVTFDADAAKLPRAELLA